MSFGDNNVIKVGQIHQHLGNQGGSNYLKAEVHYERFVILFLKQGKIPDSVREELEEERHQHNLGITECEVIEARCLKKFPALEARARVYRTPNVQPAKSPLWADRIAVVIRSGASNMTWLLFAGQRLRVGRQDMDSQEIPVNDLVLRLLPPTVENKQKSLHIGRQQFVCEWRESDVFLQRRSPAQMRVDGRDLKVEEWLRLNSKGRIEFAHDLAVRYELQRGPAWCRDRWSDVGVALPTDRTDLLLFRRENNAEDLGFAMVRGTVAIGKDGTLNPSGRDDVIGLLLPRVSPTERAYPSWLFLPCSPGSANPAAQGGAIELAHSLSWACGECEITFASLDVSLMKGRS